MASSESSNELLSSLHKRTHFDRQTSDFSYAVEDGDAELLDEVLQQMKVSERTAVLETCSPRPGLWFSGDVTPLIIAVERGYLDCVKILLKYKADIEVRGSYESFNKCTPSFIAAAEGDLDVLRCLVEHGADVNALTDDKWTPLMIASYSGHVNIVNFLFEHGANLDLQNEEGNTALHLAIFSIIEESDDEEDVPSEVANKLLSLGASQLCNQEGLTPLLLASSECKVSVVKDFIKRPECTKQQRIDALELLGASYPITEFDFNESERSFWSLHYIKEGMKERFVDPSCPFLKQPMEPIKAYQNRKESQTFEELAQIEGNFDAIIMEGLIIRERILGTYNTALVDFMKDVIQFYNDRKKFDICIGLQRHIVEICKHHNTLVILELQNLTETFQYMVNKNFPPIQKVVAEVLNEAILEYEEKREQLKDLELNDLLVVLFHLLQLLAVTVKDISTSVLLQKLCRLNPRNVNGNTLLHMASNDQNGFWIFDPFKPCEFLCIKTIKLLLTAGSNVNTINKNGDTPLHIAASFKPWSNDKFHLLTGILEVLLDGGAHHDFVNNDGKTAMDVAQTDEARRILSENKTLELKCISAKAVKKFGLPYLGLVPKTLEKYISRH